MKFAENESMIERRPSRPYFRLEIFQEDDALSGIAAGWEITLGDFSARG